MKINKPVLNGQGFVELVSYVGGDGAVIDAARVSYNGDQNENSPARDKKLIRYLLKNQHTSPFEHTTFTFHVKAPIFIARQWMRHRTWSFNEISARYTEFDEEFYYPTEWRGQSKDNKQSSEGLVEQQSACSNMYADMLKLSKFVYRDLLQNGVSREMARMVLPVSSFTRFYGTVDLHNLLRFIELRDHPHAQLEIQEYAVALREIVEACAPWTMEAWNQLKEEAA